MKFFVLIPLFTVFSSFVSQAFVSQAFAETTASPICRSQYDFQIVPGGEIVPASPRIEVCKNLEALDHFLETQRPHFMACFKQQLVTNRTLGHGTPANVPLLIVFKNGRVQVPYPLQVPQGVPVTAMTSIDLLQMCMETALQGQLISKAVRPTVFAGSIQFSR